MNKKRLKKTTGIVMAALMMATSMTVSATSVASAAENLEISPRVSAQNFSATISGSLTRIGSFINRGDAGGIGGVRIWLTSSTSPYNITFFLGDLNNNIYQGYSTSVKVGGQGFISLPSDLTQIGIYVYNPTGSTYTIGGYYEY